MSRPNILYIHSHDTGRWVQPYGFQVPTPNIQMLADQGVLFREAFCAAPTCSGSRASLLTGLYCHNNGMFGLAHRGWKLYDYRQHWVHTLREVGYRSILIGEQHVSLDPGVIGYDEVVPVGQNNASFVAPLTIQTLREAPAEPWFMSVGFFETHREFAAPTSVRDTLYSQPPPNLPDTRVTRRDMAEFKASARSLDQGIGAVLHALHDFGLVENTVVICTTDHGVAFPGAKATLFDRGTGVMLIVRGPGFHPGKVVDAPVSHLDVFPTLCDLSGAEHPDWLQGTSLMPLVRGEVDSLHDAIFSETTYHAAYQPHRAIRTERWKYIRRFDEYPHPVLANCDDSGTKELLVEAGWGEQEVPEEQLYDLVLDPQEGQNVAADPARGEVLAELRERLENWMRETDDPLLDGPVAPPEGAIVNEQWQVSPDDPVRIVRAGSTAAPSR
ncbi:MAG: N-sulfoglucosamine sulfohydrolase [Solirubrobacterales bacterium]|nr:N-sulfoglucosamine sulfohydrolase [Solirubrobacterales bacterium]